MGRIGVRHRLEFFGFRIVVCLLQMLSARQSARLAECLAFFVCRVVPKKWNRYDIAADNLRTAVGTEYTEKQIDRTIFQMWVHLFRMVSEIAQLPRKLHLENLFEVFRFNNRELTVRAMCTGRPVIVLSGHFGNWEMAVSVFGMFGFPMGVVARELDNPYLNQWFQKFRQYTGHVMLAKNGGYEQMLDMVNSGGHLAMLGDQDAGTRGMFVDFFGKQASTFKSIALLAIQHRAIICVGYVYRLEDDFENNRWVRFELGCEEVIDPLELETDDEIREMTQKFTSALERVVRRAPEQYFWVHRRWKSIPGRRKSRRSNRRNKAA
jgi:KDO2-lipid IV(A) lauroyltransferase